MLIAIGIFGLIASPIVLISIDLFSSSYDYQRRVSADIYREKIFKEIQLIKERSWGEIDQNTSNTPMYIEQSGSTVTIEDGTYSFGDISYSFTISNVQRDGSGNIVPTGTVDPHTKEVVISFVWEDKLGREKTYSSSLFLNDWSTKTWVQTSQAEFDTGTYAQTIATNTAGGEVVLKQVFYPDWCEPELAINQYNIPGSATAKTLFSFPGNTYLGTGGNSSGVAFTKLSISGVETPTINVDGTFNGYLTNNIFVSGNYAYLATTQNNKEVVILDISSTPYTEVGYFNTSRTEDANSVYVVGDIGYVAAGRYVFTFNLTTKTGSRAQLGIEQISLNQNLFQTASVSQIVIKGDYMYASLDDDWYELVITNIGNPADMIITSQTSVNNQQTHDLYVSDDTNRVYFGTESSSSEREFFIINTSSKSGARPIIGSYEANGTSIKGIAIVEADDRAILVGSGGEEYQVLNITNEASPTRCGGMQYNAGINDIDAVTDVDMNSFSYIVTNDNTNDFQILRGGPGEGGGETGYGYLVSGNYTSSVFDSNSALTDFYMLSWDSTVPANTTLRFQVRSGATSNLTGTFVGSDGTPGTYFTSGGGSALPSVISNNRYFQYRAFYTSDSISTPTLKSVTLNYGK